MAPYAHDGGDPLPRTQQFCRVIYQDRSLHRGLEEFVSVLLCCGSRHKGVTNELALSVKERVQVLIEGVPTSRQGSDWDVNKHGEHLPDPQSAASALILDRRIPPAGQMDDVISTRERQSYAAGSRRHNHELAWSNIPTPATRLRRPDRSNDPHAWH